MEKKMEITKEIISKEIVNMKEYYSKLETLFENQIPKPLIIEGTIEEFEKNKENGKKGIYPNLANHDKYKVLNDYSKTIYMFFENAFSLKKSVINDTFDKLSPRASEKKKPGTKNGKKISLCRINDTDKWEETKSGEPVCLYVGSSKDIKQRLKEHLFLCKQNTYAMHLKEWFDNKTHITIYIWDFKKFFENKNVNEEESLEHLQNIEDLLWNHYKPLFGRQGKK